jgi:transcriptional regulator with XRE-family HTH domain
MFLSLLDAIMRVRKLRQADIARMAGVSRQAVSLWFRQAGMSVGPHQEGECDLQDRKPLRVPAITAAKLARALGIPLTRLLSPLPLQDNPKLWKRLCAEFLWDRLYPSLSAYAVAIVEAEPRALARLVQARGMFEAAAIGGDAVWRLFPVYARHLHPKRREECQQVWKLQRDLGLI